LNLKRITREKNQADRFQVEGADCTDCAFAITLSDGFAEFIGNKDKKENALIEKRAAARDVRAES